MKFKVAGNDKWDDTCNFGTATIVLGQTANLECSGGSKDMPFSVTEATTIKITVDLTGATATIKVVDVNAGGNDDGNDTPVNPQPPVVEPTIDAYYVAGTGALCNGKDWDPGAAENVMTKGEDGIWTITYTNVPAGEYEVKVTAGSWDNNWGANGAANGDNVKFTVEEAGDITVKFNPATNWISVYNGENPLTNDMSLAGIGIALLAATAGVVALVGKKKEF
jgi:hypothetical protein